MAHWGYCNHNGPDHWDEMHLVPEECHVKQSPINILPQEAVYDERLKGKPLEFVYDASQAKQLMNNGHSVQVIYNCDGSALSGSVLDHTYRIAQFHFHWGKTSETGSEHRINDKMYAAEAHIVHYNRGLYSAFGDAAKAEYGLTVLGVFIEEGEEHKGFKQISDQLEKVTFAEECIDLQHGFDPSCLLPEDKTKYWTYTGSLTTPPCYETVRWIVFKDPIQMSKDQLNKFRQLRAYTREEGHPAEDEKDFDGYLVENYRHPMPLNGRRVRASFRKYFA